MEKIPDGICPFVSSPSDDCYCVRMNSDKIRDVAAFCMGKYLECRMYRTLAEKYGEDSMKNHEPSAHPQIDFGHERVSDPEMRIFAQGQGNQGIARRRT